MSQEMGIFCNALTALQVNGIVLFKSVNQERYWNYSTFSIKKKKAKKGVKKTKNKCNK